MASMDRVLELNFRSTDEDGYFQESHDWTQPHVFQEPRHTEKIEGVEVPPQGWRMKERMKTVSVALVLCLNVGVDPPGLSKLQPCARLECWVDPLSLSPQKALENIGQNLQKQYERWQPRARYKQSLDPTVDEVKKLCVSLRRNAKEERVLFHYNGHGVPCPTTNGEIWVFNRNYTQYIPLSIYDLQTWMGYPSIYVYDCNNAGIIIKSFHQFAEQHEREYYSEIKAGGRGTGGEVVLDHSSRDGTPPPPNYASCIQLGACSDSQALPMNPNLPADLFTACLTTPIRMALKWFVLQNQHHGGKGSGNNGASNNKLLCDGINLETIERVPGQLNDRRTMLGELNWIFTAITDTIAWNILPRSLFQKLFRQDLLVASLFRNFLLAERIMRSYDCTPVSSPKLPPTSHHPMWHAWDYALDQCLSQLKQKDGLTTGPVPEPTFIHTPSPFFEEQLTAFEVWLGLGNEKRNPPEQLPIVLQVLLSQVHRVRALELLGKFLDLGWWAVNLALSVGIFPYVLKLLQSSAKELRPLLVFIWAKILAVDQTCQTDLVRDGSHKYFIQMVNDPTLPQEYRTMAVFVLSNIVRNYPQGQQAALQANSIATCLLSLEEEHSNPQSTHSNNLHKWVCTCLALTWQDFPSARWCGVRDSAHEKIANVLGDGNPEVRAAAVFALGCFINGMDRTEHSNSIDHAVILMILNKLGDVEGSGIVRMEIVVALHNFVLVFENQFVGVVGREMERETQLYILQQQHHMNQSGSLMSPLNLRRHQQQQQQNNPINSARLRALANAAAGANSMTITGAEAMHYQMGVGGGSGSGGSSSLDSIRRVASSSSLSNLMNVFIPPAAIGLQLHATSPQSPSPSSPMTQSTSSTPSVQPTTTTPSIYTRVYNSLLSYERDPQPGVSILARTVLEHIRSRAIQRSQHQSISKSFVARELESSGESVTRVSTTPTSSVATTPTSSSGVKTPTRSSTTTNTPSITPIIATKFINWCWSQFSRPSGSMSCNSSELTQRLNPPVVLDPQDPSVYTRSWVYGRNAIVRRDCFKRTKTFPGKIEDQVMSKNLQDILRIGGVSCVKFHPYENLVVVGGPGVIESSSGGTTGSLNSLEGVGSRALGLVDKSVFAIFEYDDTSHLSSSPSPSSSTSSSLSHIPQQQQQPQLQSQQNSYLLQPRILNKTEIDHTTPTTSTSPFYPASTYSSPILNSLEWLNSHDSIATSSSASLLAAGCNDGCIRVYRPCVDSRSSTLVTAWSVLGGQHGQQQGAMQTGRVSHVVMKYEPEVRRLLVGYCRGAGGGGKGVIGVWDVGEERLVREVAGWGSDVDGVPGKEGVGGGGGCNEWVSCLDCNRCEPNVFVIGGEDGSIRLLDLRAPASESVLISNTWRDFNSTTGSSPQSSIPCSSSILSVRLRHDRTVVAGSANGRVRFFDLRSKAPTKTIETTLDVTGMDVHGSLPYFGIGTSTSTLNIYGFNGPAAFLSNSIREGFGGFGRIGLANNSITSVSFHEFKPFVSFVDSYSHFSVYKAKK